MRDLIARHRALFGPAHFTTECIVIPMAFLVVFLVMGVC
jgi:hypothetical protein